MVAAVLLLAGGCSSDSPRAAPGSGRGREVLVSAAVSLMNALDELARQHESATGTRVVLNLGPSNALARQIIAGARADVFVSADQRQMNLVERAGRIDPDSRIDLLANQLAIVASSDAGRPIASARELLEPRFRRVAIGEPNGVPAGVYARHYLESLGIWSRLERRVIAFPSVRAALTAAENGDVDAAIVYRSDARSAKRTRLLYLVPRESGPQIAYPAAVIKDGPNTEGGRQFVDFLRSEAAARTFERYDFSPLRSAAQ